MERLTKAQLSKVLHAPILVASENDLRFVFNVMNFDLKEYQRPDPNHLIFEIHHMRYYVVKVEVTGGIVTFSNEWCCFNENDKSNAIHFQAPSTLVEIIGTFFALFNDAMLKPMGYKPGYIKGWSATKDVKEGVEMWKMISQAGLTVEKEMETGKILN